METESKRPFFCFRGIYVQDLNPCNILLNENGELTLTYHCQWISIENPPNSRALNQLYVAPEVVTQVNPSPEADWWSVGVILFEVSIKGSLFSIWFVQISTCSDFSSIFPLNLLPELVIGWI